MSGVYGVSKYLETTGVQSKQTTGYYVSKRIIDFIVALTLLILFSPIMAVIALLIKLDSRGPVFFKQERVGSERIGKNGSSTWKTGKFHCLKFRTMVHHADPALHQAYVTALIENNTQKMDELQNGHESIRKLVRDPRITHVGLFLRKYSLDELPQFINVLAGHMSVVGPRPAIDYEVEQYKPWHMGRLNAQPGITGLQQVMARCTVGFDEQVKYDLRYIENQSLWLDLKIMALTPIVVFRHRGAC